MGLFNVNMTKNMTFQFSNGWFSKIFKVVFVVVVKVVFIVTLFYPLESSSELSWILILPEYGFILAHMTNHSIALHGLRILLSCIYLSPIMIATYLEVMIWTSIYTIWVCFHTIDINPKMLSFFGGFCRICIIIHWDLFCSVMGNISW